MAAEGSDQRFVFGMFFVTFLYGPGLGRIQEKLRIRCANVSL